MKQMWTWLFLLALVVFLLYMVNVSRTMTVSSGGCNTCPHAKNVGAIE